RLTSQNGEGRDHFTRGSLPGLVEPSEAKGLRVSQLEQIGVLAVLDYFPLEEGRGRNNTAALLECVAETGFGPGRFALGVDPAAAGHLVLTVLDLGYPSRDKPPAHQLDLVVAAVDHHRHHLD